jgi:hypothetical protein
VQSIDVIAKRVIAAPNTLERENDVLVTSTVYALAKVVRLLDKFAGTPKLSSGGVGGIRLVARAAVKRLGITLESVGRSDQPGVRRRTAGERNEHQPYRRDYDASLD